MPRRKRSFRDYYDDYSSWSSGPREAKDGIKAHSQRGAFAKNWWATRWIEALERLVDSGRLSRGRSYARKGQVLSVDESKGAIEARVQGSRSAPYRVKIQITPLRDAEWERVLDALSEQALFTAQLLAGEMPQEIEQAFTSAGVSLFPERSGDLKTSCSCPDMANPCKHIAATHYILGERFDEDPFLLFRLRGRSQEQILDGLRQRRAGQDMEAEEPQEEETESLTPLEETLDRFWTLSEPLEAFVVEIQPPPVEMPLLKRLGDPAFVPDPGLQALLLPAYTAISQAAIDLAFEDSGAEGRADSNG
jgi:uncharacterized Zn finger protein